MEILPALQGQVDSLDKIYIRSPTTGQQVPLAAFARWTTRKTEPLSISHQGQFPAVTISFNLAQGGSLGTATEAIQQAEREMQVPASLVGTFQGNAQAFQASLRTVPMLILAALFVVYLILGILYESYIHPLTILSTLPSAGAGAIATLMLFGFDFSLVAMIGVILLIGIVKKNGIMMVDFAITAERDERLSARRCHPRAALLRFRPIMMTTAAALLGGVPLMLGAGTGAEIRQPLGYAMVGGLHRQPGAHAVHHARDLHLPRSAVRLPRRAVLAHAGCGAGGGISGSGRIGRARPRRARPAGKLEQNG